MTLNFNSYFLIILSLNCNVLHYFCATFELVSHLQGGGGVACRFRKKLPSQPFSRLASLCLLRPSCQASAPHRSHLQPEPLLAPLPLNLCLSLSFPEATSFSGRGSVSGEVAAQAQASFSTIWPPSQLSRSTTSSNSSTYGLRVHSASSNGWQTRCALSAPARGTWRGS